MDDCLKLLLLFFHLHACGFLRGDARRFLRRCLSLIADEHIDEKRKKQDKHNAEDNDHALLLLFLFTFACKGAAALAFFGNANILNRLQNHFGIILFLLWLARLLPVVLHSNILLEKMRSRFAGFI
ncbi:hypothetical protein SDC9_166477 [bioreactor metagenome]|uniref:Uncharacterized protein n=1 Tax=bioreactor metagenome TaxID=1076179 RepID=A0A645FX12_9ZZZZ